MTRAAGGPAKNQGPGSPIWLSWKTKRAIAIIHRLHHKFQMEISESNPSHVQQTTYIVKLSTLLPRSDETNVAIATAELWQNVLVSIG